MDPVEHRGTPLHNFVACFLPAIKLVIPFPVA